jgi:anaerobic carbon-monoxide dehydrogenase catalytic subunit
MDLFGQQNGEIDPMMHLAPQKRQEIWKKYKVMPRGIDREVVEMLHRTNMGVDQDPENILDQAVRTALVRWMGRFNDRYRHNRYAF